MLKDSDLESRQQRKAKDTLIEMATKDLKDDTATATSTGKFFTRAEVEKHTETSKDTWIIIHNNVYNVTSFLNEVAVFLLTKKLILIFVEFNLNLYFCLLKYLYNIF